MNSLRELAGLLRVPEPGTTNLATYASERAEALGEGLRVSPKYLRAFVAAGLIPRNSDELPKP